MRCISIALVATVTCGMTIDETDAAKPSFAAQVKAGYRRNVMWPYPDICPDRAATRAPFDVMVRNGWRRQNLMGPHHFSAETGELNRAGELKVHWVMTQAPPEHRQLFVERSLDSSVTQQRISAAQDYASKVVLDGESPMVQDTHLISDGRPAAIVDFINVSAMENMPEPVLPEPSSSPGQVGSN